MTSWLDTNEEIKRLNGNVDSLRRNRIKKVEEITKRPLIIYATDFLDQEKVNACKGEVSIDGNDKLGFCEVIEGIGGDDLDILIHSPGGDPGSAETIIEILRNKYKHLRFFVPDQAKSAATMMCCAGDEIFMDEKSELGPIDPQMIITKPDGSRLSAPAQAIIAQFDKAKESIATNPQELPAWLPILQSYAPSLLSVCEQADLLSKSLVTTWLSRYMFFGRENASILADDAARYLANSTNHLSHGRRIGIEQLQNLQLNVTNLNSQPILQAAIWDLYIAIRCTFMQTPAFKIIENGKGNAFIRLLLQIALPPQQLRQQDQPNQLPQIEQNPIVQKIPAKQKPHRH